MFWESGQKDLCGVRVSPSLGQKCELQGSVSGGRAFERPAEELLVYLLKKEENQVKKLLLKAERN